MLWLISITRAFILFHIIKNVAAIHFLVVGDWGGGNAVQSHVAAAMKSTSNAVGGVDFVINVGDNFYDYGVNSTDDPQWKTKFLNMYESLPRFISILGNHDYMGSVEAQLNYKNSRWFMPGRYYEYGPISLGKGKSAMFVFLDTNPFCTDYYRIHGETPKQYENLKTQDYRVQLTWLNSKLSSIKADWTIVVGHHPVHPDMKNGGASDPNGLTCAMESTIGSVLKKHNVKVYISGHWHEQRYYKGKTMDVLITGAGCCVSGKGNVENKTSDVNDNYTWRNPNAGFMHMELTDNQLTSNFVEYTKKVLYTVVTSNSQCSDIAPDSKYTCQQQQSWGKCTASWMKGYCCQTCFQCEGCT